jgi:hypothetical protein
MDDSTVRAIAPRMEVTLSLAFTTACMSPFVAQRHRPTAIAWSPHTRVQDDARLPAGRVANCFKTDIEAVAAGVLRHKPSNKMMAAVVRVAELHRADGSAPAIAALESTSIVAGTEVTRGVGTVGLLMTKTYQVRAAATA